MPDSPFGSKIVLKKGWNKLYLIWQQFESEIEESGVGASWKITTQEPDGMKWYFSKGNVAIQGKLQGNSKMDDYIDIEKTIIRVTGVSFSQEKLNLCVGDEGYLQAIVTPSNATYPEVNWATDNEFVAVVNPGARQDNSGTAVVFDGRVNAIGFGTATITATTIDGRKVASATVNVYAPTIEMVEVIGSGFAHINEQNVILTGFQMGKYEVTQKQWWSVMLSWPDSRPTIEVGIGDDLPMYNVSWFDAQNFITKLNELSGKNYRLPTEVEWEYAARGPYPDDYAYSGSDEIEDVAWYSKNSYVTLNGGVHKVGGKASNQLGIYDMSGNVGEWCGDWYDEFTYPSGDDNPTGVKNGIQRVQRGGSWAVDAMDCRVLMRKAARPFNADEKTGFRLVLPRY